MRPYLLSVALLGASACAARSEQPAATAGAGGPPAWVLAAPETAPGTADPCAEYARDPVQRLRCAWVTGPDRNYFVPFEGRDASLRQQMDCIPDRDDRARYAACLGQGPADRPQLLVAALAGGGALTSAAPSSARGEGGFAVHLASVRDPSNLRDGWRRLAARHPGLAGLGPRRVRAVDIPGRGTFYRFLAGAFPTRAAARAACDRLRSEGGECEVLALRARPSPGGRVPPSRSRPSAVGEGRMGDLEADEHDLHALVDGRLAGERRREVEAYLAAHPDAADRVAAYLRQRADLILLGRCLAEEPVPARLAGLGVALLDTTCRQ